MGAQFSHFGLHASYEEVTSFLNGENIVVWGARTGAPELARDEQLPSRVALAVGNEGAGLSSQMDALVTRTVGIQTAATVESLNVAVAAGILLHELAR
jgi:TrmH family RNA methyltransferase